MEMRDKFTEVREMDLQVASKFQIQLQKISTLTAATNELYFRIVFQGLSHEINMMLFV